MIPRTTTPALAAALAAVAACLQFGNAGAALAGPPRLILAQAVPSVLRPEPAAAGLKPPRTEAEFGFSRESLSNNLPDWKSTYLEAARRLGNRHVLYGVLRETERFGLSDTEAAGGLYYPLDTTWTALAEASASPTHEVLPRYSLFGQLHKSLPGGWGVGLGLRHSGYSRAATNTLSLLAERYWGNFRGAYTLYSGRPEGAASASSHRFQLSYHYGERSSIGLSYATGREVENIGPPRGVISSDVQNWTLSGRHWFAPNWALTYDLLTQEQGTLYRRQGLRLGIRHSF
ncbi:MAG: YaiO family outer membrane beta-barrel protein [Burkholderiales bacterium]